ncbi:hypothetical protein LINPERPRIM_LOCUS12544, partial [Linum perenne]
TTLTLSVSSGGEALRSKSIPSISSSERPRISRSGVESTVLTRKGTVITCSKCKQHGHNRRGCKAVGDASTIPGPFTSSKCTPRE